MNGHYPQQVRPVLELNRGALEGFEDGLFAEVHFGQVIEKIFKQDERPGEKGKEIGVVPVGASWIPKAECADIGTGHRTIGGLIECKAVQVNQSACPHHDLLQAQTHRGFLRQDAAALQRQFTVPVPRSIDPASTPCSMISNPATPS